MTEAQHALILKLQANTPAAFHHIINHLVLTGNAAASMLAATLEQQEDCRKRTVCIRDTTLYSLQQEVEHLRAQYKELHKELDLSRMQAQGFQERIEQLLEENAKLKG